MKKYSLSITLISILLIRIVVFLFGLTSFGESMYNDNWHHYYLGLIFIFASIFKVSFIPRNLQILLFSIGIGLVVDEVMLPLSLLQVWNWGYWDYRTLITVLFGVLIYIVAYNKYLKKKS